MITEPRWQVDDHVVMVHAQVIDHLAQIWRGDQVRALGRWRGEEHADSGGVVDHHRVDDVAIGLAGFDRIHHRAVLRIQVEQNAHVAELQVGVHQADAAPRLAVECDSQVGGDRGPPGSALRGEDGDHLVLRDVGRHHGGR